MELYPGTIILTNNIDPERNGGYGRFNHAAISIGSDKIVESLSETGVVTNNLENLIFHPETNEFIFLVPKNLSLGSAAALAAYELNGVKYRFLSSITRFTQRNIKKGLSCISTVRHAYKKAFGYDPLWRVPDDILDNENFYHSEIYNNVSRIYPK